MGMFPNERERSDALLRQLPNNALLLPEEKRCPICKGQGSMTIGNKGDGPILWPCVDCDGKGTREAYDELIERFKKLCKQE